MIAKEVTAGFRIGKRDTLGFPPVVAGVQNGCGQDCAVCPEIVTGALGYLGGGIKNLQAKSEIAAERSGGIQQVSLQGCDVCFALFCCFSLQVVLSVRSGWAILASQRSFGICVWCVWLGYPLFEEVLCRIWASWGRSGELLPRMRGASVACGAGAGQLPRRISVSLNVLWL